jgi:hypothetical protein
MPYADGQDTESPIQDLQEPEDFDEIVPPPAAQEDVQQAKRNIENVYQDTKTA